MKDEEKSGKKWLITLIIAIVIIAIVVALYQGIFSLPTGLAAGNVKTTTETQQPNTNQPQQPTFTETGTEIISKELTESLPYYELIGNLEPGKYSLEFASDIPVWVKVYDKIHFDEIQQSGNYYYTGTLTGGTPLPYENSTKTTSLSTVFFVSDGKGGNYYILVLGNEKASIKFRVTQIYKT